MNALFQVAFLAEPARACAQTQCFVETLEEQLLLELKRNVTGTDLHPPAAEQKRSFVAIEDLLKLLRGGRVRWTAEARIVVETAELALETHPRSEHNALGIYGLGLNRT